MKPVWILVLLLVGSVAIETEAHDFWIEPSAFALETGEVAKLHLRVGEGFDGEPVPRDAARIHGFVAVGPHETKAVLGRDGEDPAGLVRLDAAGVWAVGYESRPSTVELDPVAFERYLREEGLDGAIAERSARGERQQPGRERFARSVKTLLVVGGTQDDGWARPVGLPLEIIPERSPFRSWRDGLPVRVLYQGRPLANALVNGVGIDFKNCDQRAASGSKICDAVSSRTDPDGRVVLPSRPGIWLVTAVHIVRATSRDADWESTWTSLTFRTDPHREEGESVTLSRDVVTPPDRAHTRFEGTPCRPPPNAR